MKKTMNKVFLSEHMDRLTKSIIAQMNRARAGAGHAGIKGASIEVVIRQLLRAYIPAAFTVGTGQVANVNGKISPQMDIVLYARDVFPHLSVNEDGSVVVCCESLLCVAECKTRWNTKDMQNHFYRFCMVEKARTGWYSGADMHAAYFAFVLEQAKPGLTNFQDGTRAVGVYSLAGNRCWYSPYNQNTFAEIEGNALELFLCHILQDCMRKGSGEIGTLEDTYKVVAKYFGWKVDEN